MATFATNDTASIAYGGESNDKPTETVDSLLGSVNVTPSATFAQTGTKSDAFDMTTNANKAYVLAINNGTVPATAGILVVSFGAALSGAPSSELAVMCTHTFNTAPLSTSPKQIRIGTDRKLYLYDKSGNALAGGVSTTLIPTAGSMKEVCVSFDGLNHSTVWIKVYFDDGAGNMVEELAFDSKLTWANMFDSTNADVFWGELLGASNHGCTLYLDDAVMRFSTVATEAPHLTAYPRIRVAGDVTADAQATYNAWTPGTGSNPSHYVNIQTNDGTTARLDDAVLNNKDTWKSSTANPMPGGATVVKAQLRQVGLVTGAGKELFNMMYGTVGSEAAQTLNIIGSIGTTYTARICAFLYQNGSSTFPAFADAAANASGWGVSSPGSGTAGGQITFGPGPEWVYYTATLPLGTAPPLEIRQNLFVRQAVNRAGTY